MTSHLLIGLGNLLSETLEQMPPQAQAKPSAPRGSVHRDSSYRKTT